MQFKQVMNDQRNFSICDYVIFVILVIYQPLIVKTPNLYVKPKSLRYCHLKAAIATLKCSRDKLENQ